MSARVSTPLIVRLLAAALALALTGAAVGAQERPVIFVHGLASSGASWQEAAMRLQGTLALRAAAPDLNAGATYEAQADQLQARMGAAGSDVVLIGHSNGGLVAREWSRQHPVSALVTVGTPHGGVPLVANLARYVGFNVQLLAAIGDVYRAIGSSCCSWQSLLAGYSPWWNLAYDLASGSVLQVGASLGLTAAQPVLTEMIPGSAYLSTVNSPGNLIRESTAVPTRVGVVSAAHNFYWGGALRAAFPDHGDSVAYWRDVARLGMDYYAAYIFAHAAYEDWWAFEIAETLVNASYFLAVMDEWWCQAVSIAGFGLCWANDTVVPEWSQAYPGAIPIFTGFDGPAHTQQTRMSDGLLQSVLTTYTSIPSRPSDPPPSREVVLYEHIDFSGQAFGATGDQSYVGPEWNDRVSSVHVPGGHTVVLYEHAGYGGAALTLSEDQVDLRWFPGPGPDGTWNDVVSSIRVF